ncbi:hypothetical protein PROFUN_15342, partial [Planoprotostelium fungivorum]
YYKYLNDKDNPIFSETLHYARGVKVQVQVLFRYQFDPVRGLAIAGQLITLDSAVQWGDPKKSSKRDICELWYWEGVDGGGVVSLSPLGLNPKDLVSQPGVVYCQSEHVSTKTYLVYTGYKDQIGYKKALFCPLELQLEEMLKTIEQKDKFIAKQMMQSLKEYMAHDIACFTFQVQQASKRCVAISPKTHKVCSYA